MTVTPTDDHLAALATSSAGEPRCLLIRHAERPPLTPGNPGMELGLTPSGIEASFAYGASLGKALVSVRTSPVRRCLETATHIGHGSRAGASIHPDNKLGDPGVYIEDPAIAWKNWLLLGQERVLDHLANDGAALPGFADPAQATGLLIEHLLSRAARMTGVHLAITHDSLMIPLLAAVFRRPLAVDERPNFLESIVLSSSQGSLFARYRGRIHAAGHLVK